MNNLMEILQILILVSLNFIGHNVRENVRENLLIKQGYFDKIVNTTGD